MESVALLLLLTVAINALPDPCRTGLKYLNGDALNTDGTNCLGPDDQPYPTMAIERMLKTEQRRGARSFGSHQKLVDPLETQRMLLQYHEAANYGLDFAGSNGLFRKDRSMMSAVEAANNPPSTASARDSCKGTPGGRLCRTRYNTTAPMYGVSLTSGQPVTIVQKFPDLLQQVIFEVCDSTECDVLQGDCVQTYVPYLFLVIPLGPVTLTGQDYVLVENGCVCRPRNKQHPNTSPPIQQETGSPSLTDILPGFPAAPVPSK